MAMLCLHCSETKRVIVTGAELSTAIVEAAAPARAGSTRRRAGVFLDWPHEVDSTRGAGLPTRAAWRAGRRAAPPRGAGRAVQRGEGAPARGERRADVAIIRND